MRDSNGLLRELKLTDTLWFLMYVTRPPRNQRLMKQFRLRFRLPYESFLSLREEVMNEPIFISWTRKDAIGNKPSYVSLLLLGVL